VRLPKRNPALLSQADRLTAGGASYQTMDFLPDSLASPAASSAHSYPTPTATAATAATVTKKHQPELSLDTVRETICYRASTTS
jgi:hypothetical protein